MISGYHEPPRTAQDVNPFYTAILFHEKDINNPLLSSVAIVDLWRENWLGEGIDKINLHEIIFYINFARVNKLYKPRVMNTKLTLTIEQSLIDKAKRYAKGKGRSLSDIVENYLKVMINEEMPKVIDSTPIASSLRGAFEVPKDFDYKKELSKGLSKKYLQHG